MTKADLNKLQKTVFALEINTVKLAGLLRCLLDDTQPTTARSIALDGVLTLMDLVEESKDSLLEASLKVGYELLQRESNLGIKIPGLNDHEVRESVT